MKIREYSIENLVEFSSLNLKPNLLAQIDDAGFKTASPIQNMTIEPILMGKDIFAQAETGSGKTCAFVIPILEQILRDDKSGKIEASETRYAILSPTRELAQQTHKVFEQFGNPLGIESCCVIGGESIDRQKELIAKGVHVLVATPGRLTDLIKQKVVTLKNCKGIVFDEADRLFDMGFKKEIEFILSKAAPDRQLIMLSATSNQDVLRTAYKFHSNPEELVLNHDSLMVDHLDHKLAMVNYEEKFPLLVNILRKKEDSYAIVFCNTQVQTHTIAEWLIMMGFKAKPISGKLAQNKRTSLLADFREKKITTLVCTDVAARGLDIKNVNLVVNYDIPSEAANYVHRIGRTGRAGEPGEAISFCAFEDCENLDPIYELIGDKIEKIHLEDSDFATDICKRPYIDRKTLKVGTPKGQEGRKKSVPRKSSEPIIKHIKQKTVMKDTNQNKASSNEPRVDRRFFKIESFNYKEACKKALDYFNLEDRTLLGYDILSEGKRKFFLFGPKNTEYKFFIKPIYSKLLLPFLITILKKADLDLFVKVSFKPNVLTVSFSGKDEKMLTENSFELLNSFEHLILTYLQSRVVLHRNLKLDLKCFKKNVHKKSVKKTRASDEELIKLAESSKEKLLSSKKAITLKPMNPGERRIIHLQFEQDSNIKTESIGDSYLKSVKISLKST